MESSRNSKSNGKVLVVGGGVGGIRTALDLAAAGRDVVLIDKAPSIGGLMTQLDRTFPTNNCDLCTLSPDLAESGRRLHIELLTLTQLTDVAGQEGHFQVTLKTSPRFIDLERCTACGECLRKYPGCVKFTPGLDHRAPTCMRYPQVTPQAFSVDMGKCTDVEGLSSICPAGAIVADDEQRSHQLEVSSIVLAAGAELFDPTGLPNYGYGAYPNVVTGLEYERILSASGPSQGQLVRPSDGKVPKKIAWIQCVGSRMSNQVDAPYCSSACCMYALKEAIVTKERFRDDIETVIFYMDMRASGKDYERYYQRAKKESGVRFVRTRPHSVIPESQSDDLSITFVTDEDPVAQKEVFDMVVLSTGFRLPPDIVEMAEKIGVELNEHRFVQTSAFDPVATSRPGVYVCGLIEGPKDIPETMVQASAAACMAAKNLPRPEQSKKSEEELPPERDVSHEAPKIGVFLCDCGHEIGGVVDVNALVSYAKALPNVSVSEHIGYGCSRESLDRVRRVVEERGLNRVVVGACSPRTHETKFQDTVRKAGLNKYLVEMANLRDQDTWVHRDRPEAAADKAKDLIRMAVCSASLRHPLADHVLPMNKDVLVVGGGVAGMNAALCLADQGFKVHLVERSGQLGGVTRKIKKTLEGDDVQAYLRDLIEKTTLHERIQVLTNCIIVDHSGIPGLFKTGVQIAPRMYYRAINHGVTILATGAFPHRPQEYLLDQHESVFSQLDLDTLLEDDTERVKSWRSGVMIQCVGSRCEENPNCSRVCCQAAVKNALRILDRNPDARIVVLYRDMRTQGFQELYYREARERGVIFVQYEPEKKPFVQAKGQQVAVRFREPILGRETEITADFLALSTGFIADEEATEDLAMIFKLPRSSDGYFLEDHVKLRPVDLPVPGFLVAGTAHAPKSIRESIAQAQAAAGRAQTFLARDTINLGAVVARVDGRKCAACLVCVRACPFDIPFINAEGYSEIDPAKCHGCGVCAADCPAKAIELMEYEDDIVMAQLSGLLEGVGP